MGALSLELRACERDGRGLRVNSFLPQRTGRTATEGAEEDERT